MGETSRGLKGGVLAMSAGSAVALLATVAGYLAYSRLLAPGEFALYAGALALARLGTVILDGGLKVAIVKHHAEPAEDELRSLFVVSVLATVAALALLGCGLAVAASRQWLVAVDAVFLFAYGSAYFASYPALLVPLAMLERRQRFTPVAIGESVSVTVEYALPALLWLLMGWGIWSFVVAAWAGRLLRTALIVAAAGDRRWMAWPWTLNLKLSRAYLREGLGLQLAVAASMVRDSLHLIVVAPWFGKEIAGHYAWALQLCAVGSQVFVQTATRVSIPALRSATSSASRWNSTLLQMSWLTILTAGPLLLLMPWGAAANDLVFMGKWEPALAILPWLVARMLPGLATTPLGALLLTDRGAAVYSRATWVWTLAEVALAVLLLAWMGPMGLAISYSFMAWFGVFCYLQPLKPGRVALQSLATALFARPSLGLALIGTFTFLSWASGRQSSEVVLPLAMCSALTILASIASEPMVRQFLASRGSLDA